MHPARKWVVQLLVWCCGQDDEGEEEVDKYLTQMERNLTGKGVYDQSDIDHYDPAARDDELKEKKSYYAAHKFKKR